MVITFAKSFYKDYEKLSKNKQDQFWNRLDLFKEDQQNPLLNNHKLHGPYDGFYSINISGDIRAIYEQPNKNKVLFIKIGTHNQLY
jgi:addiction module RelE/StbE family toxin